MPSYTTKRRRSRARNAARIKKSVSRDARQMRHWAARGTHKDYEKLRAHAKKVVDRVPSYVDAAHVERAGRRMMAEQVHDSSFLDSVAWVIDQIPGGGWNWIKQAAQGALKPFRGDAITEEDEVYALLLQQAYKDDPKDHMGQWTRDEELGSDYVQVYDHPDGHKFVAVRGTKIHGTWQELQADLAQDAGLAVGAAPTNIVGDELQRILDHTKPGTVVDVGGHSLGTSLIAKAYDDNPELQDRVRQTFLYNPVFSPVAINGNILDKYEADQRMRWFIDLLDTVSLGDLGTAGPSNAVYRSRFSWNPIMGPHDLEAWGNEYEFPHTEQDMQKAQSKSDNAAAGTGELDSAGMASVMGNTGGSFLDFGNDDWDMSAFGL